MTPIFRFTLAAQNVLLELILRWLDRVAPPEPFLRHEAVTGQTAHLVANPLEKTITALDIGKAVIARPWGRGVNSSS